MWEGASVMTRWLGRGGEAAAACMSYAFCSISLTLANKAIFSSAQFNYPWTILLIQSVVVALLLAMYFTSGLAGTAIAKNPIHRKLLRQLALPTTFFTLFIFSNARSLRTVSLPVLTVLKSLAPLCVAIAERALFGDAVGTGTYLAMALIVAGNIVTTSGDGGFHAGGYAWALFNITVNVAYVVSLRACLDDRFSPAVKTLHSNILATAFITPIVLATEWSDFRVDFVHTDRHFRVLFLFSCFLAAGIGASVFWVLKASSGSTLSFVGATNKVIVVILGAVFFDSKVTPRGWVGVALGITAGGCFAVSKSLSKSSKENRTRRKDDADEDKEAPMRR